MIPEDRLQEIILNKDSENALKWCEKFGYVESWAVIDGSLVIFDADNPPAWLAPILELRNEDGDTKVEGVLPLRKPFEGEYADGIEPALVPID